jgi:predicted metalloprotease with PDZ domain
VDDLFPGSAADAAGLAPGMLIRAVNGRRWSVARLRDAIAAAAVGPDGSIALLVENGDRFATLDVRYTGGLREPRLERLPGTPDHLGASITPRAGARGR